MGRNNEGTDLKSRRWEWAGKRSVDHSFNAQKD